MRCCSRLSTVLTIASDRSPMGDHYLVVYFYVLAILLFSTTPACAQCAEITVSPTLVESSGDWVTVHWSNVESPSTNDVVAVFPSASGTLDYKKNAPIKFQHCSVAASHMTNGSGTVKFRLINLRQDLVVALLRNAVFKDIMAGKDTNTIVLAVSDIIRFKNINEPLQGHLSLTSDPTQMILTWVTYNSSNPIVRLRMPPTDIIINIPARSSTYTAKDMCGSPATDYGYLDPGMIHQATMKVVPGRQFYYQFGDEDYGFSKLLPFTAAPLPSQQYTTRIIAYGDMGMGQIDGSLEPIYSEQCPSLNTTQLIMNELNETDLVLHIGDISYAMGFASVWDEFFSEIFPIATQVPYMVCIGNHERDFPNSGSLYQSTDSGGECGVPHERRFPMPRPSLDQPWYGFSYGSAHFVLMSTEHDFSPSSAQHRWIDQHLSTVDRSTTPWLIFGGHRPMYVDSTNNNRETGDLPVAALLQQSIEPLLLKHHVDIALWGHHHSYQRTCPIQHGVCTSGSPVHLVIGMAGQGLSADISPVKPDWIEYVDVKHYGYSWITTTADTLVFEYVRNDDGKVHDTLELKKQ